MNARTDLVRPVRKQQQTVVDKALNDAVAATKKRECVELTELACSVGEWQQAVEDKGLNTAEAATERKVVQQSKAAPKLNAKNSAESNKPIEPKPSACVLYTFVRSIGSN